MFLEDDLINIIKLAGLYEKKKTISKMNVRILSEF